jgi:hypothetical protein
MSINEKKVLYGLIKYPNLTDLDIQKLISVKGSTYSVIKKKLKESDYYSNIRLPILQHLGCKYLIISLIKLNRKINLEERSKLSKMYLGKYPENFFIISEANYALMISIAEDMIDFEKNFQDFIQVYGHHNLLAEEEIDIISFPFDLTMAFSYFDFAALLNRTFKLNFEEYSITIDSKFEKTNFKVKNAEFSDLEKRIYYGLIKYPELPDNLIADEIKCSRQSVTKAKEKFFEEDLIEKKRIVDLGKLGFEILAISHTKTNPRQSLEERFICVEALYRKQTPIFHVSKNFDRISITPFKNFSEFQEIYEWSTNFCTINDCIIKEPNRILLSISQMKILKNHVYAPLVKKILNL